MKYIYALQWGCINSVTKNDADNIITKALLSLNKAESEEHNNFFMCAMDDLPDEANDKIMHASYLKSKIYNDQICLAYQPIIDSQSEETAYYECLLRIKNDDKIPIGPLIESAEKTGLINELDKKVLDMVIENLAHNKDLKLSFNVSVRSIHNKTWTDYCYQAIKKGNIASRLIIEITETSRICDYKKMVDFTCKMRELGCQIAIDDFGTGYNSLQNLKEIPVNILKIDGAFVKNIENNKDDHFLVKSLIETANHFNLKTVAEFVEDRKIVNILKKLGIDFMQGYYFGAAQPKIPK